jgi:hypothetical protein
MGNGENYGEKLYADFIAARKSFELKTADISGAMLNTVISSSLETTAYLIINVYDGDTLKSSNVKELKLLSGENTIAQTIEGYADGNKVEIFVWDSIITPACSAGWNN